MGKKVAYGGVVFDREGRVLLRKPRNEYDGYKWTFAKGRPKPGETPEETALDEVHEETGVRAEIIADIPGGFEGGTTQNHYFIMILVSSGDPFDDETEEIRWVTIEEARKLISETVNAQGRKRDLAVLDASLHFLVCEALRPYFHR